MFSSFYNDFSEVFAAGSRSEFYAPHILLVRVVFLFWFYDVCVNFNVLHVANTIFALDSTVNRKTKTFFGVLITLGSLVQLLFEQQNSPRFFLEGGVRDHLKVL